MLRVIIDGQEFKGWSSFRMRRSLDTLADSFAMTVDTQRLTSLPFDEWSEIEIVDATAPVLTGYIRTVRASYDRQRQGVEISGNSKPVDLCKSHPPAPQTWSKSPGLAIASTLCEPHGIEVSGAPLAVETRFSIAHNESIFSALKRLADSNRVRVCSTQRGGILFYRPGQLAYSMTITSGRDIIAGEYTRTAEDRYRHYTYRAQRVGGDGGEADSQMKSEAIDQGVPRPLYWSVRASGTKGGDGLAAEWHRQVNAGKAVSLSYTVAIGGDLERCWYAGAEGIWSPGRTVGIDDRVLGFSGEVLIADVDLSLTARGWSARLAVASPHAYDLDLEPAPRSRGLDGRFLAF